MLGLAVLPVFWLSATLGFGLIVLLDSLRLVRASGIAAESVRWVRGHAHPPGVMIDGHLRGFVNVSSQAVRVVVVAALRHLDLGAPLFLVVLTTETAVAVLARAVLPIPGRMAPWEALAEARGCARLGHAGRHGRAPGADDLLPAGEPRAGGDRGVGGDERAATVVLFAILKRLNDTRLESGGGAAASWRTRRARLARASASR